jgi:hypothetical protein
MKIIFFHEKAIFFFFSKYGHIIFYQYKRERVQIFVKDINNVYFQKNFLKIAFPLPLPKN